MGLRILHTSDWHLGRSLHEESLLDDQAWALDRLHDLLAAEQPDALVVAGDVYDRAVPPAEAVTLLDGFLTRVAALGIPVVATAGNHDSGDRLGFGARLLETRGVHLRGDLARIHEPVAIPGKGFVYAAPFIDPEVVRGLAGDESIRGHAAATERALARARADAATRTLPTVLVAHAFVQGGKETPDSERPLSVGGAASIPAALLEGFDYVALGHLHAPQEIAPAVRYSGSLLKYSFSEAQQEKSIAMVEVGRREARTRLVPIGARRDVVRIQGTLDDLLRRPDLAPHERSLVEATLDDAGYVYDARARLQKRFAHVLNVRRGGLAPGTVGEFARQVADAGSDDRRLFETFFRAVTEAPPTGEEARLYAQALDDVRRKGVDA
jgi:DNA repair protein SbcD/Mre11